MVQLIEASPVVVTKVQILVIWRDLSPSSSTYMRGISFWKKSNMNCDLFHSVVLILSYVSNPLCYITGVSNPMTRRPPTSSPSPWSATRCTTLASWRTFVWGGQDTPSARPTSLVWNATKCSANQPGPTGEGLPGNAVVYPESAANCLAAERECERDFVSGRLPKHFVRKYKRGHGGMLSSVFN